MMLPDGVKYRPRQSKLIAIDDVALLSIDSKVSGNDSYEVTETSFEAIEGCLKGDWEEFDVKFGLERRVGEVDAQNNRTQADNLPPPVIVQSMAEHKRDVEYRKIPRRVGMTVIPNLRTTRVEKAYSVLGCSLSRYYKSNRQRQETERPEVYEFLSYGIMLLDAESNSVDMWVARPGDKVVVPTGCHMTLYNLGDDSAPLMTLQYGNGRADAYNDGYSRIAGPMLLAFYDDVEVFFQINRLYVNNLDIAAGVQLPASATPLVTLTRTSRQELGPFLYEQLIHNPELIAKFASLGIHIKHPPSDAVLIVPASPTERISFSRHLVEATLPGTPVHRFFFPDAPPQTPGAAKTSIPSPLLLSSEPTPAARKLNRPLILVVEGAGKWVDQAYRDIFRRKTSANGRDLRVFYADDTQWKGRPDWSYYGVNNGLEPWEVYLDKNDDKDALRYAMLRPDAVFVVTPDSKHAETARFWLDKTPLVFVEKPFDSDVANVEDLQFRFAQRPRTQVIGLDHYQFYALPLKELWNEIRNIVGDRIQSVDFILTEGHPIEIDRVRSLQHGLMLDLLPHLLALLTFFGDILTIDDIVVQRVWQYDPLEARSSDNPPRVENIEHEFRNETSTRIEFTFEDYTRNGFRVPCHALVGKGFSTDVKYLEIRGVTGNALRIDLNKTRPRHADPKYPTAAAFFIADQAVGNWPLRLMPDPYDAERILGVLMNGADPLQKPLETERYSSLLDDLLDGSAKAAFSSLSISQGSQIVQVLDRIWWAVQQSKPWSKHVVDAVHPMEAFRENL
jgi:predicted dehydrogenase